MFIWYVVCMYVYMGVCMTVYINAYCKFFVLSVYIYICICGSLLLFFNCYLRDEFLSKSFSKVLQA